MNSSTPRRFPEHGSPEAHLPEGVVKYAETKLFTQDTIPAALMKGHSTSDSSWGRIVIRSGTLLYQRAAGRRERLSPARPGIIVPGEGHSVTTEGPVSFHIEFYRASGAKVL